MQVYQKTAEMGQSRNFRGVLQQNVIMTVFGLFATVVLTLGFHSGHADAPSFASYPATVLSTDQPTVLPILRTREERRFSAVLRNAVTKGYGVVEGGTERERRGPNFGGHYVLVQWSCGLDCSEAAVIDTKDGTVLALPRPGVRDHSHDFIVKTSPGDFRNLRFQTDSYLLGIPNVVDAKVNYFVLRGHAWNFIASVSRREFDASITASKGFFGDQTLEVINFQLKNDTGESVKTNPESWKLIIDGQVAPDPGGQLWMGGRPKAGYAELTPGETLRFGKGLPFSQYFPEPRGYKVVWVGADFESNTVIVHGEAQR